MAMEQNKLLTIEELTAWRDFDKLRRGWELREAYPHEGFRFTRYLKSCLCHTCAALGVKRGDGITAIDYVKRHNHRLENEPRELFYKTWKEAHGSLQGCEWNWNQERNAVRTEQEAQSRVRAKILHNFIECLKKDKELWADALTIQIKHLSDKSPNFDKIFLLDLIQTMIGLIGERTLREEAKKEVETKVAMGFDASLRAYVPPIYRTRHRKEWCKT